MASPGPRTSGPSPWLQSTSVATSRMPALRPLEPTKPDSAGATSSAATSRSSGIRRGGPGGQPVLGDPAGLAEWTTDVLVVHHVVEERLGGLDDPGDPLADVALVDG